MRLRLVTLDFWQTLFADTADSLARAHALRLGDVRAALAEAGRIYAPATLEAADREAGRQFASIWATDRDMSPGEQIERFLAVLDPGLPGALDPAARDRVARAYQDPVLTHRPALTPGVPAALAALCERGLALAVISNTGRTPGRVLRGLLADAGLLPHLAILVFSDEVGFRKPAAAIFEGTLRQAGVEAGAAVHVGDNAEADVRGARAVGMRAIHFVPEPAPDADAPVPGITPADMVLRRFADLPALVDRLG